MRLHVAADMIKKFDGKIDRGLIGKISRFVHLCWEDKNPMMKADSDLLCYEPRNLKHSTKNSLSTEGKTGTAQAASQVLSRKNMLTHHFAERKFN